MQHSTAYRAAMPRAGLFFWFGLLVLLCAALVGPRAAYAGLGPSPQCPTLNISVANGGSVTTDVSHCASSPFGVGLVESPPSHGTATTDHYDLTYTHDGSNTTSDSFILDDGDNYDIQVNVTIAPPVSSISIAPGALSPMVAGTPYSEQLTASGGAAPYTWALDSGTLPTGLSLSSSGLLSGTPTDRAVFAFTVRATDAGSASGVKSYNPSVGDPNLLLAPTSPVDAVIGKPYSVTFAVTGGVAPYTLAWDGTVANPLPPGLSLSGDTLSGTPSATGTFTFGINVTDSSTDSDGGGAFIQNRSVTLTVNAQPTITLAPAGLPNPTVGVAYSQTVTASGGTAPYTYDASAGALPSGLSLNASTGAITGTPTAGGPFNVTLRATDADGFSGTHGYALTVAAPAITLAPVTLPDGQLNSAYSATISASGGTIPYSFAVSAGALPGGLSLASDGTLSGTPSASGTFNFDVTVTDASGGTGPFSQTQSYTLQINVAPPVANPVAASVAYGSGANPIALNITGGTPTSVAIDTAASHGSVLASGTSITYQPDPGFTGSDSFTYTASNANGTSAPATVSITVSPPTLTLTPATLPAGTAGSAYSQSLTASGGIGPYTFAVTAGALPAGLSLAADGTLSGTPSANGAFAFIVQALDANGQPGTHAYNLAITAATLTLAPATLPPGVGGVPYSQSFSTNGGVAPYSYALTGGALPAGLTLAADGNLSGTPIASGMFNFDVRVTDSSGGTPSTATVSYALQITGPTITVNPSALPAGIVGTHYAQTLSASGGVAPYSYTISNGALPGGLALATDGRLSGTLTASGRFTFTVRARDANGFSGTRDYSLVIEVRSDPSKDPEVLGLLTAQTTATRRFARAQIGNFQQRLESLHAGGGAGFSNGFTVPMEHPCRNLGRQAPKHCERLLVSTQPLAVGPVPAVVPTPASPLVAATSGPFGLWTGGALRFGDFDARRGGNEGFEFETTGISIGADYRTGPSFALGAGFGYGHDETRIGDNGSRSEADGYNIALYASYHPGDHFYLDGLLGYQLLSFELRRYVTDNGNQVYGERDATQWFASISNGYEMQFERLGIASYARLNVARARIDGYTEQGDDTYALAYAAQDVETTTTSLGMRLDYQYLVGWGRFSPQLRLEYQHDFQDQSIAAMRYADLAGPLYRAGIDGFDRSRFVTGIGAALYTDNDFGLRMEYRRRIGSSSVSVQSVRVTVEKWF
ncbi:MAG: putative Ig domain-containing protein [Nitrococcus sp.]|nr:putative Ig domain-containing protein [Nitrococcus sp.]